MSLLRPIIRACAVAALRDKTWAQTRVYDSDMTPLAEAVLGQAAAPYIVVYTDTDDLNPVRGMAEMYDGENRNLSVVLEIGVASAIRNTTGQIVIQFAATDQGMEWAVDCVTFQAIKALIGDPHSKWGNLFKELIYKIKRMPSRRGGQAQSGVRFAARRVTFVCNTIYDYVPGSVLNDDHPIKKFVRMVGETPASLGISDLGQIVTNMMDVAAAPNWRQAQAMLGMSTRDLIALTPDGTPLPIPPPWETTPADKRDEANEFAPFLSSITVNDVSSDLGLSPGILQDFPPTIGTLDTTLPKSPPIPLSAPPVTLAVIVFPLGATSFSVPWIGLDIPLVVRH